MLNLLARMTVLSNIGDLKRLILHPDPVSDPAWFFENTYCLLQKLIARKAFGQKLTQILLEETFIYYNLFRKVLTLFCRRNRSVKII